MDNKDDNYLYHYTSIENLLLILKNKTIAFNSLQNVDDLEECDSKDIKQVGKLCYVSCWTKEKKESIPMWNMYTPNMQGVRIRLKKNPFKIYHYSKGEFNFDKDVDSCMDYKKIYEDNKVSVFSSNPILCNVQYTNDDSLIYPKVKTVVEELEDVLSGEDIWLRTTAYSFENLGKYKRENWRFQAESRYIINMLPFTIKEYRECRNSVELDKLMYRIEDIKREAPYILFFLELSEEALEDVEILLAPRVNEAQRAMVELIKDKYCNNAIIKDSTLRIR